MGYFVEDYNGDGLRYEAGSFREELDEEFNRAEYYRDRERQRILKECRRWYGKSSPWTAPDPAKIAAEAKALKEQVEWEIRWDTGDDR